MTIPTASLAVVAISFVLGTLFALALCKVASRRRPNPFRKWSQLITAEQKLAARNATEQRRVLVRYVGVQPGFAHIKPMPLFNVVEGDYARGSTVTLGTLHRLGLTVEVIE